MLAPTYQSTLRYLYGLQRRGMKFGLRNIKRLLRSVGNPEKRLRTIHVGGTNGKGSTAAFLASVFTAAGYRTGLYTSPHLVRFTERIRMNGQEIPEAQLVEYVRHLRPMIDKTAATFFEATTCIAFQYFADEGVDIAVIEVGLGGRLDSTNVIFPMVSIITNISLEHTEYLGTTLVQIAREKGGIIKPGIPCVTASTERFVVRTLERIAERRGTRLYEAARRVKVDVQEDQSNFVASFFGRRLTIRNVRLGLRGNHQVVNAATAMAALDILHSQKGFRANFRRIGAAAVRRGFERVRENTGLRGRLESVGNRYLLDVAHNAEGMRTLISALPSDSRQHLVAVFGVLQDKDYKTMCRLLGQSVRHIVACRPRTPRALGVSPIVRELRRLGVAHSRAGTVRQALTLARRRAGPGGRILVTGSHYVVGEALEILAERDA